MFAHAQEDLETFENQERAKQIFATGLLEDFESAKESYVSTSYLNARARLANAYAAVMAIK